MAEHVEAAIGHRVHHELRDLRGRELARAHRLLAERFRDELALREGTGAVGHVGRTVALAVDDAGRHVERAQHRAADLLRDQR